MKRDLFRQSALSLAVLLVAGLVTLAPAPLGAQVTAERAAVTVFSGGVFFRPWVDYERAVLTISGGGKTFTQTFEAGRDPAIGLYDPQGKLLADGEYTWELSFVPNERAARQLRIAASRNGGEAPEPWAAQSGVFVVRGGSLATPDVVEPGADPAAGLKGVSPLPQNLGSFGWSGASRAGADDSDEMVAAGRAVETPAPAAQRGLAAAPQGFGAGLQLGRVAEEDSDAAALARPPAAQDAPGRSAVDKPASVMKKKRPTSADGTNGRPRSDEKENG